MQMSRRALRMDRRHRRQRRGGMINLVSMMDIFTILVFFLLVNSSEVEVLQTPRDVHLPESVAEERARETVIVTVTDEQILVQGRPVSPVAEALAGEGVAIPAVTDALRREAQGSVLRAAGGDVELEVTILGDREIPFRLLKRVMASCTAADYHQLSLAVVQKGSEPAAPTPLASL